LLQSDSQPQDQGRSNSSTIDYATGTILHVPFTPFSIRFRS
jgi:hypothetical protein